MPKKREKDFRTNLWLLAIVTTIVAILILVVLLFFNLKPLQRLLVHEEPIEQSETPEIIIEAAPTTIDTQKTENLKSLMWKTIDFRRRKIISLEKELSNFKDTEREIELLKKELERLDSYILNINHSRDKEIPTILRKFYNEDVLNSNIFESKLKIVPTFVSLSESLNSLKAEETYTEKDFLTNIEILSDDITPVSFRLKELYFNGILNQAVAEVEKFLTEDRLDSLSKIQTFLTKRVEGDISKLSGAEKTFVLTANSLRSQLFLLKNSGEPPVHYKFAHGDRSVLGTFDSIPHSGNVKILFVDVVWRNNRELNVDHTNIYTIQDNLRDLMRLMSHDDLQLEFDVLVFAVDEDLTEATPDEDRHIDWDLFPWPLGGHQLVYDNIAARLAAEGTSPDEYDLLVFYPAFRSDGSLLGSTMSCDCGNFCSIVSCPEISPIVLLAVEAGANQQKFLTALVHEIGHAFGMPAHAHSLDCNVNSRNIDFSLMADCSELSEGDSYSVMGYEDRARFYETGFMDWLGWLQPYFRISKYDTYTNWANDGRIFTVNVRDGLPDQVYQVGNEFVFTLNAAPEPPYAIRILLGPHYEMFSPYDTLYLEYRRPTEYELLHQGEGPFRKGPVPFNIDPIEHPGGGTLEDGGLIVRLDDPDAIFRSGIAGGFGDAAFVESWQLNPFPRIRTAAKTFIPSNTVWCNEDLLNICVKWYRSAENRATVYINFEGEDFTDMAGPDVTTSFSLPCSPDETGGIPISTGIRNIGELPASFPRLEVIGVKERATSENQYIGNADAYTVLSSVVASPRLEPNSAFAHTAYITPDPDNAGIKWIMAKTTAPYQTNMRNDRAYVYPITCEICDGESNSQGGVVDAGCDDDGDGWCDGDLLTIGTPIVCSNGGGDDNDNDPTVGCSICQNIKLVLNPISTLACDRYNEIRISGRVEFTGSSLSVPARLQVETLLADGTRSIIYEQEIPSRVSGETLFFRTSFPITAETASIWEIKATIVPTGGEFDPPSDNIQRQGIPLECLLPDSVVYFGSVSLEHSCLPTSNQLIFSGTLRNNGRAMEETSTLKVFGGRGDIVDVSSPILEQIIAPLNAGETILFDVTIPAEEEYEFITSLHAVIESPEDSILSNNEASITLPCQVCRTDGRLTICQIKH